MARVRIPLVFGESLDRETGSMAIGPGSMEDLRNVWLRRGKVIVRRGFEEKLTLQDPDGVDITDIVAIQSVRSDRSGIILGYQSGGVHAGRVFLYRVDAELSTSFLLLGPGPGGGIYQDTLTAVPILITTESYSRVFIAHDEGSVGLRQPTIVYDPFAFPPIYPLQADFEGTGLHDVRFRGVTRHLAYLFGWGYGGPAEDRAEMVRASQPGEPTVFNPEHYFMIGDRRDPVVGCYSTGLGEGSPTPSLVTFKEAETWRIKGTGRDNFGEELIDTEYGLMAGRLGVMHNGVVYFWSAEGPRLTNGFKPSTEIAWPLDLIGFEPTDLIAAGDLIDGFADYVPAYQIVVFFFGARVYALNIHEDLKWTWWELAFTPRTSGRLFSLGTVTTTPPTAAGVFVSALPSILNPTVPEILSDLNTVAAELERMNELDITWSNSGNDGDEDVEIWARALGTNVLESWEMDVDADADELANDFAAYTESPGNFTGSLLHENSEQKVIISASTGAGINGVAQTDDSALAGEEWEASIDGRVTSIVGTARGVCIMRFLDAASAELSRASVEITGATDSRYKIAATAPASTAKVQIILAIESLASGDTGDVFGSFARLEKTSTQAAWAQVWFAFAGTLPQVTARVPGFLVGKFYDVGIRFRRAGQYDTPYQSSNPEDWPATARGNGLTQLPVPLPGTISVGGVNGTWNRKSSVLEQLGLIVQPFIPIEEISGIDIQIAADDQQVKSRTWAQAKQDYIDHYGSEPALPGTLALIHATGDTNWTPELSNDYTVRYIRPGDRRSVDSLRRTAWLGPTPMNGVPEFATLVPGPGVDQYQFTLVAWPQWLTAGSPGFEYMDVEIEDDNGGGWVSRGFFSYGGAPDTVTSTGNSGTPLQVRARARLQSYATADYSDYSETNSVTPT